MIFNTDSTLLPLQREWPFNLIAYLLRLSNLFVAASTASLAGLLVLTNVSKFRGNVWVLPLAFALIGILLNKLTYRLVVSEARRLLQTVREAYAIILKNEKAIDRGLELAGANQEKRAELHRARETNEELKQKIDQIRERIEDVLTTSSGFSKTVAKLMAMVAIVRQLASASIPNFSRPDSPLASLA